MPETATTKAINVGMMPEARFQCEGAAGTLTADRMDAVHFRDDTGGYHPPS